MKVTLKFELPAENDEYQDAINGQKNSIILDEIWNRVFRPYYKHGYADTKLNTLLATKVGAEVLEKLQAIYQEVLNENN